MGWAVWADTILSPVSNYRSRTSAEPAEHYVQILAANQNVFVLEDKDTLQEWGYSLTNGSKLWGPVQLPGNGLSTLSQAADIAYGRVYTFDLGGFCTAIDLATGKIDWVYESANAGYNTPYGIYPIWQFGSDSIAGGEIFFSLSRMYDPPMFENATRLALNCYHWTHQSGIYLASRAEACGAVGDGYPSSNGIRMTHKYTPSAKVQAQSRAAVAKQRYNTRQRRCHKLAWLQTLQQAHSRQFRKQTSHREFHAYLTSA